MMASSGDVPPGRNPFSRPSSSSSLQQLPTLNDPTITVRPRRDSIEALAKYPYLYAAALKRPAVYQTPYPAEGGFSAEYMPKKTDAPQVTRKTTASSEEFLTKRTPQQQEEIKAHIRQMNSDRMKQREAQLEKQRRQSMQPPQSQLQKVHHQQQQQQQRPYVPLSTQHYQQQQQYHHHQPYSLPQTVPTSTGSSYQPSYSSTHYHTPIQHQDVHPPSSFYQRQPQTVPPLGLQFQSQQDFQCLLLREAAQQHEWAKGHSGYGNFVRISQQAGRGVLTHSDSDGGGGVDEGGSGSPLRKGMRAGGGEMLPMMGDQF